MNRREFWSFLLGVPPLATSIIHKQTTLTFNVKVWDSRDLTNSVQSVIHAFYTQPRLGTGPCPAGHDGEQGPPWPS